MEVVILCGGTGTRLKEMTEYVPKPMIPIGGKPMIHHIMKTYEHYGHDDFILALGYKQELFKMYFSHYNIINENVTITGNGSQIQTIWPVSATRKITLIDTGPDTLKGGRLKKVEQHVKGDTFFLTYGDGLCDVDLDALLKFHKTHGKLATVTGVSPIPRFGKIEHSGPRVLAFRERPEDDYLINGGYFVFNRAVFKYLTNLSDLEIGPLEVIARNGELQVYHHQGFWRCCDTLKDLEDLQRMWDSGKPKWRVWE